jgi:hypothetical protein
MYRRNARPSAMGVLAAAVALATPGSVAASSADQRGVAASASHLQVTQVEYRLELSSAVVKAGPVNLEAIDRGRDPHDLRLQAQGSGSELAVPQLTPGQAWSGVVRLKPGIYRLWCSLPEHARLGMHTTLRVVR